MMDIRLLRRTTVETVVLLSKGKIDSRKVRVEVSLEDQDISRFRGKGTYGQIKEYVAGKTGLKVSSLYIAQTKEKYGLEKRENFNKPKSDDLPIVDYVPPEGCQNCKNYEDDGK